MATVKTEAPSSQQYIKNRPTPPTNLTPEKALENLENTGAESITVDFTHEDIQPTLQRRRSRTTKHKG